MDNINALLSDQKVKRQLDSQTELEVQYNVIPVKPSAK